MTRTTAIAALACLSFATAVALAQSPPAEPRVPGVATPAPQTTESAAMAARAHDDVDARACLEFVSNIGVIRCAEKYRHAPAKSAH